MVLIRMFLFHNRYFSAEYIPLLLSMTISYDLLRFLSELVTSQTASSKSRLEGISKHNSVTLANLESQVSVLQKKS